MTKEEIMEKLTGMSAEDFIKDIMDLPISIYISRTHRTEREFILDMESRGLSRKAFLSLFDVVFLPNSEVVEILGYDGEDNAILTNKAFEIKKGVSSFTGKSGIIEKYWLKGGW